MNLIKVLIVDDYRENVNALSALIEKEDIEIFSASNAPEALELISNHDFALALLDVEMPNVGGLELAGLIRGVKKFKSLPIIFVTAHQSDAALIFKSYEAGAVDLLFKPLNPDVVRAKVRMFVELASQKLLLKDQVAKLEELRLEAEAANIAKSNFLANMSHLKYGRRWRP